MILSKKIVVCCYVSFLFISGCAPMIDNRGNFPEEKKLEEIVPGKTSAFEIERLFGSPSSRSVFGDNIWYYISSKQKRYAFYKPEELERKILAITFDNSDIVSKINYYDYDDAVDVKIAAKETKTYGHSIGFLEQIVGNLGRFESTE